MLECGALCTTNKLQCASDTKNIVVAVTKGVLKVAYSVMRGVPISIVDSLISSGDDIAYSLTHAKCAL